jgi:hypothetical protein
MSTLIKQLIQSRFGKSLEMYKFFLVDKNYHVRLTITEFGADHDRPHT